MFVSIPSAVGLVLTHGSVLVPLKPPETQLSSMPRGPITIPRVLMGKHTEQSFLSLRTNRQRLCRTADGSFTFRVKKGFFSNRVDYITTELLQELFISFAAVWQPVPLVRSFIHLFLLWWELKTKVKEETPQ